MRDFLCPTCGSELEIKDSITEKKTESVMIEVYFCYCNNCEKEVVKEYQR